MKKFRSIFHLLIIVNIIKCIISSKNDNRKIRPASHSGTWYQNSPELLSEEINQYLLKAKKLKNSYVKSFL